MLPITLLNAAQGQEISIECKSGRKYQGKMQACDLFMNVTLENAKRISETSSSSDEEPEDYPELYLRGYSIKYVKVPDSILSEIVAERQSQRQALYSNQPSRSDHRR